jgi:hypothetical protein
MPAIAITGKDTLVINGHVFHDLADGDCGKLVYDEDLSKIKVGKDGNAVIGQNQGGRLGTLTLRVVLGASDDKYLNGLLANYLGDSAGYVLDLGSLFKNVGDGAGNRNSVVYNMAGASRSASRPAPSTPRATRTSPSPSGRGSSRRSRGRFSSRRAAPAAGRLR